MQTEIIIKKFREKKYLSIKERLKKIRFLLGSKSVGAFKKKSRSSALYLFPHTL